MNQPLPSPCSAPTISPWTLGITWYALSNLVVCLGVYQASLRRPDDAFVQGFCRWDGARYAKICREGYYLDPREPAQVAFPPGYPLPARAVMALTGLSAEWALVLVAQVSLAAAFVTLAAYVLQRWPDASPALVQRVVAVFGFLPSTFYLHMALSEAPFVLTLLLMFLAMQRGAPLAVIALLAGLATALRLVGLAALLPLLLYAWRLSASGQQFALRVLWLVPLGVWGLASYVLYLGLVLGDPLALQIAQEQLVVAAKLQENKWLALLTLRPLWCNFVPDSPCFWMRHDPTDPWTSMMTANPLYFALAVVAIAWGGQRRWLDRYETSLAIGLLAIPYLTRSHEICFASGARYAAVVFPTYLVLGRWLYGLPRWANVGLLPLGTMLLLVYSFKYASFAYNVYQ